MSTGQQPQPLTGDEFQDLTEKLDRWSATLSPKEAAFVREAFKSGVVQADAADVKGYTFSTALVYLPGSSEIGQQPIVSTGDLSCRGCNGCGCIK